MMIPGQKTRYTVSKVKKNMSNYEYKCLYRAVFIVKPKPNQLLSNQAPQNQNQSNCLITFDTQLKTAPERGI